MALFSQALPAKAAPAAKPVSSLFTVAPAPVVQTAAAPKPVTTVAAPKQVATTAPAVLQSLQSNAAAPTNGQVRSRGIDSGNPSTDARVLEQWNGSTWVPITNEQAIAASGGNKGQSLGATGAITWNKDVATSVGQLLGIIPQGTVATGGYLDAKVAELRKTNPALAAEYDKVASGIQNGTMNQDAVLNYFIDREYKNQSTDYGSLAKAPYRTFTPYAEKAPEYKPFSMADFIASPDYQFRLEQGQNAIDRAGSARGNFYSGGALKEAAKFGSDLAAGEYNNARNNYVQDYGIKAGEYGDKYSRYNQDFSTGYGQAAADSDRIYNRYAGLAGAGSGVANAAVANNANNAAQAGNIYGQTANARAAAGIQGANNITQLLANSFGTSSYGKPKYDPNTGARIS